MENLIYEAISPENIQEATTLVHSVFVEDAVEEESPGKAYLASLYPEKYQDLRKRWDTKTMRYYLVRDPLSKEGVGVTGFYTELSDPEEVAWLGWFCVDLLHRRQGLGRAILEWTISEVRKRGFKKLRLYTSTNPNEAIAQILYEKMGLRLIGREGVEEKKPYTILYRELSL